VFRVIPSTILTAQQLGLSPHILALCALTKGLVLVTGPTGSGKSTTLCAMIDHINKTRQDHIITIEDPIEFVHANQKCLINQREVRTHTSSFKDALRAALREDPDIILVGELRDLETIQLAITAAETGHLCFGTLHTQDAPSTIDRIIDVFPPHQQTQIRVQLATTLAGVVAQILIPRKDGQGRVAAREIMVMTPAISNLIREGKTHMLYGAIDTGAKFGMVPMDRALAELLKSGAISTEEALTRARNPDVLKQLAGLGGGMARPATAIG
jgi:twitching motility protein PilT